MQGYYHNSQLFTIKSSIAQGLSRINEWTQFFFSCNFYFSVDTFENGKMLAKWEIVHLIQFLMCRIIFLSFWCHHETFSPNIIHWKVLPFSYLSCIGVTSFDVYSQNISNYSAESIQKIYWVYWMEWEIYVFNCWQRMNGTMESSDLKN